MDKYDENALVQIDLAKEIVQEVKKIKSEFDTILELGSGTGLLTKEAVKSLQFDNYIANDIVEKSKNYITKILPNATFIHGNALKIKIPQKADLILSNAMFQWFNSIDEIIKKCKSTMRDDGIIAFSTFGKYNFTEINSISGITLNYFTLEQILDIMDNDFDIVYADEYTKTLNFNTPLELLAHMKNTGVNSLSVKPWTVKEVKNFCEKYLEKFDTVHLTYNPIIIVAKLK